MLRTTRFVSMHGKPTTRPSRRARHSTAWWKKAHAPKLTYKPLKELMVQPAVQLINEEVYGFPLLPEKPNCFQCKTLVDTSIITNYVWIPSGNATLPTLYGYVFHRQCFRCPQCHYRFFNNKFFSKEGQALCLNCARGYPARRPIRRWSLPMVDPGRAGSRAVGPIFPRWDYEEEWVFDKET